MQPFTDAWQSVYSPPMDWKTMRALYERLYAAAKAKGENQVTIASRAGLRQNQISRLFEIDKYGPQAENFIKAIEGLDMRPSDFFRQLEAISDESADLQTSTLRPVKPSAQDAGRAPEEGLADAASSEIEHFTDRLAAALVANVRRRLAEGDRPAPAPRAPRPKNRRRIHRRNV